MSQQNARGLENLGEVTHRVAIYSQLEGGKIKNDLGFFLNPMFSEPVPSSWRRQKGGGLPRSRSRMGIAFFDIGIF